MIEATITSKGQVTIPKAVRDALNLEAGKEVIFILERKEAIMLPKVKNPMQELIKLRNELPLFSEKEINEMIKENRKGWNKAE
ncbi:AbrB/MazE/SpoVT family DNA-binding domain-containing protein [Candidatus Woesearchaeota archaeon]|nr:AbrB/MazE/SpoVT family DNA-binding domain-containing protein [Candidatus Woesearchaeota archaeon]